MLKAQVIRLNTGRLKIVIAILISGLSWYFSYGLNGSYWPLVWLAPIPVLSLSLKENARTTFLATFLAYFAGRLSWLSYLARIAAVMPATVFIVTLSLIFALIMVLTRWIVVSVHKWYTVFAFPVFYTAFEYFFITFSPHGTAFSIANTQVDCVPLIQIASLTGILGITFIILFIPSVIVTAYYYKADLKKRKYISRIGLGLIVSIFLYGYIRSEKQLPANTIKVGLVVLDEKIHTNSDNPAYLVERKVADAYIRQISVLASKGAKLVLLPERAIGINAQWADSIRAVLKRAAILNHVFIIAGNTEVYDKSERNSAIVFDTTGNIPVDYTKKYLIPGLESQFTSGNRIGLFPFGSLRFGVAICKDMDFPKYIRQYGRHGSQVLFIPAWDFGVDGWLHSRMAILRSVENGFSQVRCARRGRLSINDPYGRVTSESSSANGEKAYLLGSVSPADCHTFYTRTGNWFGPLNAIGAVILIMVGLLKPGLSKN